MRARMTMAQIAAHQLKHGFKIPTTIFERSPAGKLVPMEAMKTKDTKRPGKRRGEMNATESEFAKWLDGLKKTGHISRYEYEGVTLRVGKLRYTPDFVIFKESTEMAQMIMIEVKGGYKWKADVVRFKAAMAYWNVFEFQLWEKTKEGWKQTI